MLIDGIGLGQFGISSRKFRSHSASSVVLSNAINSDSIVDLEIHVCLEDFHYTISLPSVKINPLVNLESTVSDI